MVASVAVATWSASSSEMNDCLAWAGAWARPTRIEMDIVNHGVFDTQTAIDFPLAQQIHSWPNTTLLSR